MIHGESRRAGLEVDFAPNEPLTANPSERNPEVHRISQVVLAALMLRKSTHLTLQHFILRSRVLQFYRSVIRATRHIPGIDARRDTRRWIRGEIERSAGLTDTDDIEQQLSHLQRLMKQVLPGFNLAARQRPK